MVERVYGHHSPDWLLEAAQALTGPVAPKTKMANIQKRQ
jgi:hypothetical protein